MVVLARFPTAIDSRWRVQALTRSAARFSMVVPLRAIRCWARLASSGSASSKVVSRPVRNRSSAIWRLRYPANAASVRLAPAARASR